MLTLWISWFNKRNKRMSVFLFWKFWCFIWRKLNNFQMPTGNEVWGRETASNMYVWWEGLLFSLLWRSVSRPAGADTTNQSQFGTLRKSIILILNHLLNSSVAPVHYSKANCFIKAINCLVIYLDGFVLIKMWTSMHMLVLRMLNTIHILIWIWITICVWQRW